MYNGERIICFRDVKIPQRIQINIKMPYISISVNYFYFTDRAVRYFARWMSDRNKSRKTSICTLLLELENKFILESWRINLSMDWTRKKTNCQTPLNLYPTTKPLRHCCPIDYNLFILMARYFLRISTAKAIRKSLFFKLSMGNQLAIAKWYRRYLYRSFIFSNSIQKCYNSTPR